MCTAAGATLHARLVHVRLRLMRVRGAAWWALLRMPGGGTSANGGPLVLSYRMVHLGLPTIVRVKSHYTGRVVSKYAKWINPNVWTSTRLVPYYCRV